MKKRKDIEEKYKWDLSQFCENDNDFEKKCTLLEKECAKLEKYKGKLKDKKAIFSYLEESKIFDRTLGEVYLYSHSILDGDLADRKANARSEKLSSLMQRLNERLAFTSIELEEVSDKLLNEMIADKKMKEYDKFFKDIKEAKKHKLHKEVEEFLSGVNFLGTFSSNMRKFCDINLKFPDIKDEKGKSHKLDNSLYGSYLHSKDRQLRKNAIVETHKKYGENIDFLANNYLGYVKMDCYFARKRKYNSALEEALKSEDITRDVYDNLIKVVKKNLDVLFDFFEIKRKKLGLKDFYNYDSAAPMEKACEKKYSYDVAMELIKEALAPLGEEYISLLDKAKNERWIDVYPNENKRSGAYENSSYPHHPIVLTNFEGGYESVTTLAHELGHAMHSYFAYKNQPQAKADYTIFLAEIASTTNEMLLIRQLIDEEKDKNRRASLIAKIFDLAKSTIYRQTMFAEFEEKVHDAVEKEQPLTKDDLNELYFNLNKEYFGKKVKLVKEIEYEWARIPHFFTSFYVYKYAVGLLCALYFTNSILSGEKGAVEKYLGFLSAGGSDTPINILKKAGCDLENPKTLEGSFKYLRELLKEL